MPKVDWITWKTDVNEIIKPNKIIEDIEEKLNDYEHYMNSVIYEGINYEISNGGLSKDSFNIMGISPANDSALKIVNNIDDLKIAINNLKQKIYSSAKEQKKIEKEQLINAIEKKMIEEEKALTNTINLKEKLNGNNKVISSQEIDNIIDITNERINRLKERLEKAKAI